MIKKNLDKIFIFFGCIIIMSAITIKLTTVYKQKKLIDDYNNYILNMQKEDSEFNKSEGTNNVYQNEAVKDEPKDSKLENTIGVLSIPKIDLKVAIGQGVDNEILKYSVGHFQETALPGEKGNFCLIGHRSYNYGQFFNRLDQISSGDEIIVNANNKEYKYKVTNIKVVEPEEVSVLNQTDDSEITLITCTPIRIATHRLIVKGALE
ncbi:sortase family protein [Clostridium puniceum]|uniref:Sortase family protein n=1 Tax=Clostridium puniceum TaxID=29367 RepID=A0A1S8TBS3_9CLOT|nr:class D sortase [Clostridium puniceum]OOM75102.1 sortase family protein [Clostridium puniceum]